MEINQAFQVLGLADGATNDEIKRAYRELLMVWHPDRFPPNSSVYSKAVEQSKALNAAYECLKEYRPTEPQRESGPTAGSNANQGYQQPPPPPPRPPAAFPAQLTPILYIIGVTMMIALLVAIHNLPRPVGIMLVLAVFGIASRIPQAQVFLKEVFRSSNTLFTRDTPTWIVGAGSVLFTTICFAIGASSFIPPVFTDTDAAQFPPLPVGLGALVVGLMVPMIVQFNRLPWVRCPRCNIVLRAFRLPSSIRQWIFGGWKCKGCGIELNGQGCPSEGI